MGKPTRYYVRYEDVRKYNAALIKADGDPDAVDVSTYITRQDATSITAARKLARALAREHDSTTVIYERRGIRAEHPFPEYPAIMDWDWDDEESIEEYTRGQGFTRYEP